MRLLSRLRLVEGEEPLPRLSALVEAGAEEVYVDARGARDPRPSVQELLDARAVAITVRVVADPTAIRFYLERGAESVALGEPPATDLSRLAEWCQEHPGRLLLALEAREGRLLTGGRVVSRRDVVEFLLRTARLPLRGVVFESHDAAGAKQELDHDSIVQVLNACPHPLYVSGGVRDFQDLRFLQGLGVHAALFDPEEARVGLAQAYHFLQEL